MPWWFAVFICLFIPLLCIVCVLMGSFLMWCKHNNANPVNSVRVAVSEIFSDKKKNYYSLKKQYASIVSILKK